MRSRSKHGNGDGGATRITYLEQPEWDLRDPDDITACRASPGGPTATTARTATVSSPSGPCCGRGTVEGSRTGRPGDIEEEARGPRQEASQDTLRQNNGPPDSRDGMSSKEWTIVDTGSAKGQTLPHGLCSRGHQGNVHITGRKGGGCTMDARRVELRRAIGAKSRRWGAPPPNDPGLEGAIARRSGVRWGPKLGSRTGPRRAGTASAGSTQAIMSRPSWATTTSYRGA